MQGGGGASSSVPTSVAAKLNGSNPARPGQTGCKEDEGWEFVPARVPDGISLRNFGIQVVSLSSSVSFVAFFVVVPHYLSLFGAVDCTYYAIIFVRAISPPSTCRSTMCAQMRLVFDSLGSVLLQNRRNDQQLLASSLVLMPHA